MNVASPSALAVCRNVRREDFMKALKKQRRMASQTKKRPQGVLERVKGIEPSSVAWEATALPLSYTRVAAIMSTLLSRASVR